MAPRESHGHNTTKSLLVIDYPLVNMWKVARGCSQDSYMFILCRDVQFQSMQCKDVRLQPMQCCDVLQVHAGLDAYPGVQEMYVAKQSSPQDGW